MFSQGEDYSLADRGYETPCWIWRGNSTNYATVVVGGVRRAAHRVLWEQQHGPAPALLRLHHLCEVPRCVNPDHLQLVTESTHRRIHNSTRKDGLDVPEDTEAARIGSSIRDRREGLGLSQSDLAKQIGVPDMTVSRWERGKNVPEIHRLRALAGIFGCTIDDLVGPNSTPTAA